MSQAKKPSKGKRRGKALPALGIAGVAGLSLTGVASATTGTAATDVQSQNVNPPHEIFLGEEEISDVSLSTFYVFDKESAKPQAGGEKVAWWRGCGGCRCGGCRCGGCGCGWRGCGGCGGCGCCWRWGRCAVC
jgi:hypothetical protein